MEEGSIALNLVIERLQVLDLVNNTKGIDGDEGKLVVQVKFDDICFDVTGDRSNIDSFRGGRSIELKSTLDGFKEKLTNPISVKVYRGNTGTNLIGEATIPWPESLASQINDLNFKCIPFYSEYDIRYEGRVVGTIGLATMLRGCDNKCGEPNFASKTSNLKLDSSGNIKIYEEIKNEIDKKDIFFIVGSSQNPNLKSTASVTSVQGNIKYPLHLNTDHFRNVKGKLVSNFSIVESACRAPSNQLEEVLKELKKCSHSNMCESIFGKIEDASNASDTDEDSISDLNKNPESSNPTGKCLGNSTDHCQCNPVQVSSDSEFDEPPKEHHHNLSDIYLASIPTHELKRTENQFPKLLTRCCENCNEDLTYHPKDKPCQKCGFNAFRHYVTNCSSFENIAEQWGENEITFIRQKGFSKYDHCTCKENSSNLCIYCAINQMRERKHDARFNEYVKEAQQNDRNQVDQMCQDVLSKRVAPLERDEHGPIIRRSPEDVPKLSKMLEWLKSKCAHVTNNQLECRSQTKTRRLEGGSEVGNRVPNEKMRSKERKHKNNIVKEASKESKSRTPAKILKLTKDKAPNSKRSDIIGNTSKDIKHLVNMNFDEATEQSNEDCKNFKSDWIVDDVRDTKLKKAIRKLCQFNPADVWRKEPKPLTKEEYLKKMMRKHSRKYTYCKKAHPVYASERHRHCIKIEPLVPRKMGWLWNAQAKQVQKGWRPGKLKKPIRELMEYFLREFPVDNLPNTKKTSAARKLIQQSSEDLTQKPTLKVQKKDGQYLITMNPLKDVKTLQTSANPYANTKPIQFKITKNSNEIKRRQVKKCLKEAGFGNCMCKQPISGCRCRSWMEKERLDKTVHYLSNLLQTDNLADIICLSDTTDSESELNLEITPPAGQIKPHLRGKTLETQATQYNEDDTSVNFLFRHPSQIKSEIVQKIASRSPCSGVIQTHPCKPKIEDNKMRKKRCSELKNGKPEATKEEFHPGVKEQSSIQQQGTRKETLDFAKNKAKTSKTIERIEKSSGKLEKRARGGADIPPEGKSLSRALSKRMHTNSDAVRKPGLSEELEPARVTKPMNRWERFRRRRPVRPPWDDTIYVPPPLKNSPRPTAVQYKNKPTSPCRHPRSSVQDGQTKITKNIRNPSSYRYGLKKDKACNTDNLEVEKKADSPVSNTKPKYHRHCIRPASAPPKGAKRKPISTT